MKKKELLEALIKYRNIKETFNTNLIVESLVEIENQSNIQHHFLVNHRDKLISINDTAITYFLPPENTFLFIQLPTAICTIVILRI